MNASEQYDKDQTKLQEIERLRFLEQSMRTKLIILTEQHSEVKRQLMYLEKQEDQGNNQLGDQNEQFENPSFYLNSNEQMEKQRLDQQYSYDDDSIDEEEDYDKQNINQNQMQDAELFEKEKIERNTLNENNSSQPLISLFPKLMKQKQLNQQKDEPKKNKKKRISSIFQSKKLYPFKKMKPHPNDEPDVVFLKLSMREKYDKFLKKLRQEMPFYLSSYGQIRYPEYIKKKVSFFCRYMSRNKLVEDTKIGAEAVTKWVKVYSDWMDDKLENNEPNETFEEYLKQRQSKSSYIMKKQQLNCQPYLNNAISKQVLPLGWPNFDNNHQQKLQREKFKFKQ